MENQGKHEQNQGRDGGELLHQIGRFTHFSRPVQNFADQHETTSYQEGSRAERKKQAGNPAFSVSRSLLAAGKCGILLVKDTPGNGVISGRSYYALPLLQFQ
jgi:hypothetical protein